MIVAALGSLSVNSAMQTSPRGVSVNAVPIELFRFIKFGGLTASGGEAKECIGDGRVFVNGTLETRKRRKLMADDRVTFANQTIVVQLG